VEAPVSQPINREQRRLLKKQGQEVDAEGQVVGTRTAKKKGSGAGSGGRVTDKGGTTSTKSDRKNREVAEPEERTSPGQFTREVRTELRKVSWPTRPEVINYSLVVLVTVIALTVFIGLLDWLFSITVLELFRPR